MAGSGCRPCDRSYGGDAREAVKALIMASDFLEAQLAR
jgi:hypothetical protein